MKEAKRKIPKEVHLINPISIKCLGPKKQLTTIDRWSRLGCVFPENGNRWEMQQDYCACSHSNMVVVVRAMWCYEFQLRFLQIICSRFFGGAPFRLWCSYLSWNLSPLLQFDPRQPSSRPWSRHLSIMFSRIWSLHAVHFKMYTFKISFVRCYCALQKHIRN